jgi:hypothetical protein
MKPSLKIKQYQESRSTTWRKKYSQEPTSITYQQEIGTAAMYLNPSSDSWLE